MAVESENTAEKDGGRVRGQLIPLLVLSVSPSSVLTSRGCSVVFFSVVSEGAGLCECVYSHTLQKVLRQLEVHVGFHAFGGVAPRSGGPLVHFHTCEEC